MLTDELTTPIGTVCFGATSTGLARVRFPQRDGRPASIVNTQTSEPVRAQRHLAAAREQLAAYFDGTLTTFDLDIDWTGVTGMRREILGAITRVPFGAITTYGELARDAGQPGAAQAVGQFMGSNPVPIVVPCHRVLAADGLGGFGGGLETKQWLLALEGVLPAALDLDWG